MLPMLTQVEDAIVEVHKKGPGIREVNPFFPLQSGTYRTRQISAD